MQVAPPGLDSVNGSSVNMGCTSSLVDGGGVLVCESRSYLVDGCSPDIDTSTSDWASQLVTVRRSEGSLDISFPHVLLTFGFNTAVSLTGIEMDWFLCPDWGIGAPSITVYLNEDYNLASTNIFNFPFVFPEGNSLQSSCDSLSTVTFSGGSFEGSYYRTIHILVTLLENPSIDWVHVGEVRFIGIDSPTCQPTPSSSLTPMTTSTLERSSSAPHTTTLLSHSSAKGNPPTSTTFSQQTSSQTSPQISPRFSTSLPQHRATSTLISATVVQDEHRPPTTPTMTTPDGIKTTPTPGPHQQILATQTIILIAAIGAGLLVLFLLVLIFAIYCCMSRKQQKKKENGSLQASVRIKASSLEVGNGSVPAASNPIQFGFSSPLHEQFNATAITASDTQYEGVISRRRQNTREDLEYSYAYVSLSEARTKVRFSFKYDYIQSEHPSWSLRQPQNNEKLEPKKVEAPTVPVAVYSNIPNAASPSFVPKLEIFNSENLPPSPDEVVVSEHIDPSDFTSLCMSSPELGTPQVYGPVYPSLDPLPGRLPPLRISRDNVSEINEGSGEYGCAVLGVTNNLSLKDMRLSKDNTNRNLSILLALKKLHPNPSPGEQEAFDREVEFMYQLKHPNVVQFIGVCYEIPAFLIMEYMEEGDLNQFLQRYSEIVSTTPSNEDQIATSTLVYIAAQIASGTKHLANLKFIHRDLATRKCFVGSDFTVKLADFGTNTRYLSHYYQIRSNILMPIRWMATECFYGKFSEKTDVWAFGITMWELFTLAREVPYPELSDKEVIQNSLTREYRKFPPKPANCPKPVYELMERCWCMELNQRATFTELDQTLQDILK